MVYTRSQLIDNQVPPVRVEVPGSSLNPVLPQDPAGGRLQRETAIGHAPSVGTRTQSSPYDPDNNGETDPIKTLKELTRIKLEHQVLMDLYKEQVAVNGLKARGGRETGGLEPTRSRASHTREEVGESTARSDKGRSKPKREAEDRHRQTDGRIVETALPTVTRQREEAHKHNVWERLGDHPARFTQSERQQQPQHWAEKDLRKMIHSAIEDKGINGRTTADLARRALGEDQGSPFTSRIQDAPSPRKFGQPKFTMYDGRSDPADHVRHYKQVMAYWRNEEALMCRMFPASLGDSALRWFDKLPPGKIDSFRELAEQFTARFITNSRVVKGPEALTHIKKKHGEALREYSQRYWELYQETEDCDLRFAVSTFKFGLPWDSNGIYNDLTRRPPKNFNDLLTRVDEFSRVEDNDKNPRFGKAIA